MSLASQPDGNRNEIAMGSPEDVKLIRSHVPRDEDMFFQMQSGNRRRMMFGEPLHLDAYDKAVFKTFKEYQQYAKDPSLPESVLNDPGRIVLRYLYGFEFSF